MQDERNQVLIAYLWIRQTWHDAYLRWNKEDYDGLEVIRIPSSLVWRPDLVLYNKYARTSHRYIQPLYHDIGMTYSIYKQPPLFTIIIGP